MALPVAETSPQSIQNISSPLLVSKVFADIPVTKKTLSPVISMAQIGLRRPFLEYKAEVKERERRKAKNTPNKASPKIPMLWARTP